jgi:biotin operon repressor
VSTKVECSDPVTGVYYGMGVLLPAKKKRRAFRTGYFMAVSKGIINLIADKELGGEAVRVFLGIAAHMGYQNEAMVCQVDLAEKIGLHQSAVSRALKKLIAKGYVVEKKSGRLKLYTVNPEVAFKGRPRGPKEDPT